MKGVGQKNADRKHIRANGRSWSRMQTENTLEQMKGVGQKNATENTLEQMEGVGQECRQCMDKTNGGSWSKNLE